MTVTFYVATLRRLPVLASLKAIGASTHELSAIVLVQVVATTAAGCFAATTAVGVALVGLRSTPISMVVTPIMLIEGQALMLAFAMLGALLSVAKLYAISPGETFR